MDNSTTTIARRLAIILAATVIPAAACEAGPSPYPHGDTPTQGETTPTEQDDPNTSRTHPLRPTVLDERIVDYGEALRTASIKLLDITPSLRDINRLRDATDQREVYDEMIDEIFDHPRLTRRLIAFWRDTFRQGGGPLDTAPVFAARLMAEGRDYRELFTAADNTCPTYDSDENIFVDGECDNGVTEHAGVLTNPGSMAQFYGNMAFRRVRWIQETFACSKFPAEYAAEPTAMGAGEYTAPWDFEALPTEPIDFQDTSSVICANCHATMNRIAPLFAHFDENGALQETPQVFTPTSPEPIASDLGHWLVEGEPTAWRMGAPAATLVELGQAIADDPEVRHCLTARLWNFTMSKEDIVSGLATVPLSVIEPYTQQLAEDGDMKAVLKRMLKSDDFVSF